MVIDKVKDEYRLMQADFWYETMTIDKAAEILSAQDQLEVTILYKSEDENFLDSILSIRMVGATLVRLLGEEEDCREGKQERKVTAKKR